MIFGAGVPFAATVKDPADPTVKVVEARLVKAGAWPTFNVKFWVAVPPLFVAVNTRL